MHMKNDRTIKAIGAGLMLAFCAAPVFADEVISPTDGMVLYGINKENGQLLRYDFDLQSLSTVGTIGGPASAQMAGINASAHLPEHQNIYGFWNDDSDGKAKLVYIDCESAVGTVIGDPLGDGIFTGATAAKTPDGGWLFPNPDGTQPVLDEYDYTVFGIHEVESETSEVVHVHGDGSCTPGSGDISINPNNSPHNEFTVSLSDGSSFTRDDLHDKNVSLDENGVFYSGPADSVWVKPKGNGNQNGFVHDGVAHPLENGKTYLISGDDMQITVYNDHIHSNGKAMGHWWVSIDGGCIDIEAENESAPVSVQSLLVGLYQIDHKTGQTRHLMALSRHYDGLATADGQSFLATSGTDLYKIDPNTQTETLLGTTGLDRTMGLEVLGSTLMGFENVNDELVPVNMIDGSPIGLGMDIGANELGTIIFTDAPADPVNVPNLYD